MFDLSIKDKPKTPFGKLKDKMKIKKRFDMESSSAIVPSNVGRLDSDEEEEKKPKSKAAAFFKGHLRKSSLTKSNTSLGSDSTISSSSGAVPTNTGISIVLTDTGKKPTARNNSLSTEPSVMDHEASPRLTHKRAFSDEVSQVNTFPEPKAVQNLKPKSSPISKSSMCINGSHVYTEVPPPRSPSLEKSSQASKSFQNILKKSEEAVVPDVLMRQTQAGEKPERKSATPPVFSTEEEKISLKITPKPKLDQARVETKPVQVTSPMVFSEDLSKNKVSEVKPKEEKAKDGLQLESGKKVVNKAVEDPKPHVLSSSEDRSKVGSWFGSKDAKDTPQKPSPHPVKPISAAPSEPSLDKKTHKPVLSTALTSGLELLKHVTTGQHSSSKKQELDRLKDVSSPDQAAKYYHLTHDELIKMLLQREAELENKDIHMQELEDYIDQLLVRIMDQAPALLQVPLETKK